MKKKEFDEAIKKSLEAIDRMREENCQLKNSLERAEATMLMESAKNKALDGLLDRLLNKIGSI